MGSVSGVSDGGDGWQSVISVRHRNGVSDGSSYGLYLRSNLTTESANLIWNRNYGTGKWQGERTILDSGNYGSWTSPKTHTHTKSQISDFPSSLPASDVYSWAKASTKPSYSWSEITSKPHIMNMKGYHKTGPFGASSSVTDIDLGVNGLVSYGQTVYYCIIMYATVQCSPLMDIWFELSKGSTTILEGGTVTKEAASDAGVTFIYQGSYTGSSSNLDLTLDLFSDTTQSGQIGHYSLNGVLLYYY